jgi:type IV pilus assembly protein PilA
MPGNGAGGLARSGERGFTLIELLIVILIIAVLAAMAIPVFLNQRAKAQDTEAKAALRTAAGAIEVYHHDHNTYAGADPVTLVDLEPSLTDARNLTVVASDAGYTLTVESASGANGGGPFTIRQILGTPTEHTCGAAGKGGCSLAGRW